VVLRLRLAHGHASERHDLMSQETHAARWIGFRQPVLRVALERQGKVSTRPGRRTRRRWLGKCGRKTNSGSSSRGASIPTGPSAIRKYFESPYQSGEKPAGRGALPVDLRTQRARSARGRQGAGADPLAYMRKYGAFLIADHVYRTHETPLSEAEREGASVDPVTRVAAKSGAGIGVLVDGQLRAGFPSAVAQARVLLADAQGLEVARARRAHLCAEPRPLVPDRPGAGRDAPAPTFRLPTLIHSRSGNAKWLYEISHNNPLWLHPEDAARFGRDHGRTSQGRDGDRLLRGQGLGHRVHPPRDRRLLASPRPVAASRGDGRRALVDGPRRPPAPGPGAVADAPCPRSPALRERGSRLRAACGGRIPGSTRT